MDPNAAKLLVRDIALTATTLLLFALDATWRASGKEGVLGGVVASVAGAMAAVVGFLLHEWGHALGAKLAGSRVYFSPRLLSVFLFHFDAKHNDRRQFLVMSYGGYAASVLGIVILSLTLPLHALSGRIGGALMLLGVLATFILEIPTTLRVHRGGELPEGEVYSPY